MIELIGAPFDLCGPVLGSRLGPTAMRLLGVVDRLRAVGVEIEDGGNAFAMNSLAPEDNRVRAQEAVKAYKALKSRVGESYQPGTYAFGCVGGPQFGFSDDFGGDGEVWGRVGSFVDRRPYGSEHAIF